MPVEHGGGAGEHGAVGEQGAVRGRHRGGYGQAGGRVRGGGRAQQTTQGHAVCHATFVYLVFRVWVCLQFYKIRYKTEKNVF